MAPKKGQRSKTMRGKRDYTTKKSSKYHVVKGHRRPKMGKPYSKRRGAHHGGILSHLNRATGMFVGGVVDDTLNLVGLRNGGYAYKRSGPASKPPGRKV